MAQLLAPLVPPALRARLADRLEAECFDAGAAFQMLISSDSTGEVAKRVVALTDLAPCADVWLIDHAWVFTGGAHQARRQLEGSPPLVERLAAMFNVVAEVAEVVEHARVVADADERRTLLTAEVPQEPKRLEREARSALPKNQRLKRVRRNRGGRRRTSRRPRRQGFLSIAKTRAPDFDIFAFGFTGTRRPKLRIIG